MGRGKENVFLRTELYTRTWISKLLKNIFAPLQHIVANWAELPPELLQLVARRLPIEDYINFAAVCTSWRCVAVENYNPKTRQPWLVELNKSADFFSIPGLEKGCRLRSEQDFLIHNIDRGWIVEGWGECGLTLLNPLSHVTIKLPALKMEDPTGFYIDKLLAISASPSQSADYSVMIILEKRVNFNGNSTQQLWVWRSKERAWKRVGAPSTSYITQLIHYKGQFVALDNQFQILALDEDDAVEGSFTVRVHLNEEVLDCCQYLVECSGSLLLVGGKKQILDLESSNWWEVRSFRAIELDLERNNWKEVKSLGNASLFLNNLRRCSSFSIELDSADESTSNWLQPNCIYYFESSYDLTSFHMRIYHMDGRHVERMFEREWESISVAWIQPFF